MKKSCLFVFINRKTDDTELITSTSLTNAWKELRKLHKHERNWELSGGIE